MFLPVCTLFLIRLLLLGFFFFFFFSMWAFFHQHSRITWLQGKGEGISLIPHYYFHPRHRCLDISRAFTTENSPLHIARSRTPTGNLWFPSKLILISRFESFQTNSSNCLRWRLNACFARSKPMGLNDFLIHSNALNIRLSRNLIT